MLNLLEQSGDDRVERVISFVVSTTTAAYVDLSIKEKKKSSFHRKDFSSSILIMLLW